jgi:hypothetical protein
MYNTMLEMLDELIVDMRYFNTGEYACRETALALTKLEEARMWLCSRTMSRGPRAKEPTQA